MKKSIKILWTTILFLVGVLNFTLAQTSDKTLLAELAAEEQEAIDALVLYPAETRQIILEATTYPEALVKMESIHKRSTLAFREIMETLPQNSQEVIWDLTRYPGLIHELAKRKSGSEKSISMVLANYPVVIHKRAKAADENKALPFIVIDELNQSAESAFQTILDEYPIEVQNSLQEIIALPEVLSILTENIRLTLLVGDLYQKDPSWVMAKADSLNLEVARQNAKEIEDWKVSLEKDPEAMKELTASMKTYQETYGYDDDYYEYDLEEEVYRASRNQVTIHHYHYSYSYWLGYPYWYEYPRWRYYPSWYDWGFYYYPNRPVVIIGLPSFHFTHWFFHNHHHHHRYSHLSARFVKHYHRHRRAKSSISTTVDNWHHRHRTVISDNWMKDDGQLSKRFKEYGKLESSREKYNKKHPNKKISQLDYIKRNNRKYPTIDQSQKEQQFSKRKVNPTIPQQKKQDPSVFPKKKNPKVVPKKKTPKVVPKKKRPTVIPRKRTEKRKPNTRILPKQKINKGKTYHQNSWERSKVKRQKPTVKRKAPRV